MGFVSVVIETLVQGSNQVPIATQFTVNASALHQSTLAWKQQTNALRIGAHVGIITHVMFLVRSARTETVCVEVFLVAPETHQVLIVIAPKVNVNAHQP